MTAIGGKRKAREYDPKLVRVARALDSVILDGATFASGTSEQFPLPAIAFRGQSGGDDHELTLPVRAGDTDTIKARGVVEQHNDKTDVAWEVDGGLLDTRNPRWLTFLTQRLTEMRTTLAIAATAAVEMKLSKLRLVDAGGSLVSARRNHGERARAGVFGTLVVVLPGTFEGGDITVHAPSLEKLQKSDSELKQEEGQTAITWRPSTRDNQYDLAFAALYDCCASSAEPIKRGKALCLVYDLRTTTPIEVPLFVGPKFVQRAVESSLSDYFDNVPTTVVKRLKLGRDVWQTINEFTAHRHFAYIVDARRFEDLKDDDRKIADSLAAFCAQSGGQYVLYLARALCSRYSHAQPIDELSHFYDDGVNEMNVTLREPWLKLDESDTSTWVSLPIFFGERKLSRPKFPPVSVRHVNEVAPLGGVEDFPLKVVSNPMDETDCQIFSDMYDCTKAGYFTAHALVVQPAAIELSQGAKLQDREMVARLRALLDESRDKALQYARRVLYHRPVWKVNGTSVNSFREFVRIAVEINDRDLYTKLLHTAELAQTVYDLRDATAHFGWDACEESIIKRILSTSSLGSRMNLAVSVLRNGGHLDNARVDRVLDALLSLYPWTDIKVEPHKSDDDPSSDTFGQLLLLATSVSRIRKLVSVKADPELMVRVTARGVTETVISFPDREMLQCAVVSCLEHYQPMIAKLRNDLYKQVFIMDCCPKCEELRTFVRSDDPHTTVSYTNAAERGHIEVVLTLEARAPALVKVEPFGRSKLRLIKVPKPAWLFVVPRRRLRERPSQAHQQRPVSRSRAVV